MSKSQPAETLRRLQKLNINSQAKKQNILRLARAFNRYFLKVTSALDGAMWYDCRFYIEQDIGNIRKWNGVDRTVIINIMNDMESNIISKWDNGHIPDYFLYQDNRFGWADGVSADVAPFLRELLNAGYSKAVNNILEPDQPTYITHGTATEYIALFRNIKNYYTNQRVGK